MKYVINDNKIAGIIEGLIKTYVIFVDEEKFDFVENVTVKRVGEKGLMIKLTLDRDKCEDVSKDINRKWFQLSTKIRWVIENYMSKRFSVMIIKKYSK